MDPLMFLRMLDSGGEIVSSNDCSAAEIAMAQACGRFFVQPGGGFGYVYRPKANTLTLSTGSTLRMTSVDGGPLLRAA